MSDERRRISLRGTLLDPIVLAAILGVTGGAVSAIMGTGRDHSFEREQKRCERAFTFLQDEDVNPRLARDEAFYRAQRTIAARCSAGKDER